MSQRGRLETAWLPDRALWAFRWIVLPLAVLSQCNVLFEMARDVSVADGIGILNWLLIVSSSFGLLGFMLVFVLLGRTSSDRKEGRA